MVKGNVMTRIGRSLSCFAILLLVAGAEARSARAEVSATQPAASAAANNQTRPEAPPSESDLKTTIVVHGKVLGPDNRPVANARVFLSANWTGPIELGATHADGAYRFALPEKSFHRTMDGSPTK